MLSKPKNDIVKILLLFVSAFLIPRSAHSANKEALKSCILCYQQGGLLSITAPPLYFLTVRDDSGNSCDDFFGIMLAMLSLDRHGSLIEALGEAMDRKQWGWRGGSHFTSRIEAKDSKGCG